MAVPPKNNQFEGSTVTRTFYRLCSVNDYMQE